MVHRGVLCPTSAQESHMVSRAAERFRATGLKRQEPPNLGLWCPTPYSLSDLAGGRRLTLPQPPQNMSPDRSLLNHTFFHIREREPLLPSKGIFTDSSIRTWMCHFRGHRPAHLTHRCCVCSQQGDERGPKGTSYTVELYHRRTQKL